MSASTKRTLAAADLRIGTAGNVMRTVDQAETLARWGLSGDPVSQMPASDIRTISRMFAGDFPATMNEADIEEFGQINELFEACC